MGSAPMHTPLDCRPAKDAVGPRRKVKSGCRTCKIRKVKCDEGRPACNRCLSSHRVCDGYGIWGGGGNGYDERYGSRIDRKDKTQDTVVHRFLDPRSVKLDSQEADCFQWFTLKSVTKLPGIFGSTFWDVLVLPASSTEPAILHAVLALSSAHRGENLTSGLRNAGDKGQFTLRQYSKAIHHLQPHLTQNYKGSATVPLTVCLLFTYLEYFCGRYNAAATHLQSGLKLLREMNPGNGTLHSGGVVVIKSPSTPIARCIVECFARLHVQGVFFGQRMLNLGLLLQPDEADIPSPVFDSVGQARDTLDKILHALLHVNEISRDRKSGNELTPRLGDIEVLAQSKLLEWLQTHEETMRRFHNTLSTQEIFGYRLLLIYQTMANIMAHCLESTQETRFDSQVAAFASIIKQSIDIWKNHKIVHHLEGSPASKSIADIGWITPLYYTALKCRNPRIRLQAIRLLSTTTHREGVWDAKLVLRILRKVVQLEQQEFYQNKTDAFTLDSLPEQWELDLPILPESYRFYDMQVNMSDDATSAITVTCKSRGMDCEPEVQVHHLDKNVGI